MSKPNIEIIKLSSYVRPQIVEKNNNDWVLNGENNEFYQYIIDRYNGSSTNSAIIDSYSRMIYGLGLNIDIPLFNKKEVRKIVKDFEMFEEASFEIIYKGGKPLKIVHTPKEKIAPEKANEEGKITGYWYCYDWSNQRKYPPKRIDAYGFGKGGDRSEIFVIKDYQVGQFYFSNPSYVSALQYAKVEEEISNFFINHVQNKFMVSTIINLNNGVPESEEERNKISREYKGGTTGTNNAGVVVVAFNDSKENATTIEQVQIVDAYQQYEFLSREAQQKLMVAHKVVSSAILGISNAAGFSSNAEEIETAFNETMLNVIQPKQEIILDAFQEVFTLVGGQETLEFIPLRQAKTDEAQSGEETTIVTPEEQAISDAKISYNGAQIASAIDIFAKVKEGILTTEQAIVFLVQFLNIDASIAQTLFTSGTTPIEQLAKLSKVQLKNPVAEPLIELGEIIDENEWELVDETAISGEPQLTETALHLAKVPSSFPNVTSEQDTSLFKIRYQYAGAKEGERDFCNKMISANKVYRKEDIELAGSKVVNPGLGLKGADTYSIWLYKGGVNCKHFWIRKIYLRKNNKSISVNQARKMILDLDPDKRKDAMWEENNPLVAQPAQASNNFFKAE
jgi:hypothetical protein